MNILVYAYQLSPDKGSEYGLAWDYIINMSKSHNLTVLYGTCNGYHNIGNTDWLENYIKENPIKNVNLIPVKPNFKFTIQNYSLKGIYTFYKQYQKYQKDVLRVAENEIQKKKYDLIHWLGPIGYREPGMLYKLDIPYLWGPVGGVYRCNKKILFKGSTNRIGAFSYLIKDIANKLTLLTNRRVKKAMKKSDLVIGCTMDTTNTLKMRFKLNSNKLSYLPQNCIKALTPLNENKFQNLGKIKIIWVGGLDNRKSLISSLRVIDRTRNKQRFELNVIGDGSLKKNYKQIVKSMGLDELVYFHGSLPREKVFEEFNKSHLFMMTSLHDSNPTVVWEAMSYGVPTISWKENGLQDFITDKIGFIVPITSYNETISKLAEKLDMIADNPSILIRTTQKLIEER